MPNLFTFNPSRFENVSLEDFFTHYFHVHLNILDKVVSILCVNFGAPCTKPTNYFRSS
jgi:hypothetical protein